MDITRGHFDKFSSKQTRSSSKLSFNNTSTSSSLEQLPADVTQKQNIYNYSESEDSLSDSGSSSCFNNQASLKQYRQKLKENLSYDFDDFETDPELLKELKRIKKLDKILLNKTQREKEVKHQRFLYQKSIHSEFSDKTKDSNGTSYADASSNLSKYLALLPPTQQLDILIERNEETNNLKPIFQTQFSLSSDHIDNNEKRSINSEPYTRPKSHTINSKEGFSENKKPSNKPSSAGSKRNQVQEEKQDFIQRNIQLAKDAGSYVSMTEEEKKRLSTLLEDIDDLDVENEEEGNAFMKIVPLPSGEGYMPESNEIERLQEIDQKLQSLMSSAVYGSISSTPRQQQFSFHSNSSFRNIEAKIAKSNLTEALNPEQRLQGIESRLLQLDTTWKENCNKQGPYLSDNQLQLLLAECSRPTSPNSIMTSIIPDEDFKDLDDNSQQSYRYTPETETSRASSHAEFQSEEDLDSYSGSVVSTQSKLSKECLDKLLNEAKASLGIPINDLHNNETVTETSEDNLLSENT